MLLLTACDSRPASRTGVEDRRVSEPARRYFENLRAHEYALEELPEDRGSLRVFRLDDLEKLPADDRLGARIVHDWLNDEARIGYLAPGSDRPWTEGALGLVRRQDTIYYQAGYARDSSVVFTERLRNHLGGQETVVWRAEDGTVRLLFPQGKGRAELRTLLTDYLKLIDRI